MEPEASHYTNFIGWENINGRGVSIDHQASSHKELFTPTFCLAISVSNHLQYDSNQNHFPANAAFTIKFHALTTHRENLIDMSAISDLH